MDGWMDDLEIVDDDDDDDNDDGTHMIPMYYVCKNSCLLIYK